MCLDLSGFDVILASNSPRRKELLSGLGIKYRVKVLPDIDESYPANICGAEIPVYIAKQKACAYKDYLTDKTLLLTADTIVLSDDVVYGKPTDLDDACGMLRELSGKTHLVITGVCITSLRKQHAFAVQSEVRFTQLDNDEIAYYVNKYKPLDKAGAYGIQEWIGYVGIEYISGSYFNIMGLPVQKLYQELKLFVKV